jgi:hypothetical protein
MNIFLDKYPLEYKRRIALKVLHFTVMENNFALPWTRHVVVTLFRPKTIHTILVKLHKKIGGGHFSINFTIKKY